MSLPDIQIVEVNLTDLKTLHEISGRTFYESFADANKPENMQFYLHHHLSEERLHMELSDADSGFYFAKRADEVLGYFKINRGSAQTVLPNDGGMEIERIYVDRPYKGQGIGQLFIHKAAELAKSFEKVYVWLGVWEYNAAAIRFYEKNGFQKYSQHIFYLGDDPQTDWLMKKPV